MLRFNFDFVIANGLPDHILSMGDPARLGSFRAASILVLAGGVALVPLPSMAADALRVGLVVRRPAQPNDCPDAPAIAAAVARVVGHEALDATGGGDGAVRIEVEFSHGVGGYVARVREEGVHAGERVIVGKKSCADLVESVAIALATALDDETEPLDLPASAADRKTDPPASTDRPSLVSLESRKRAHVELAGLSGWGFKELNVNPFGYGFGARAGLTYWGLYLGVWAVRYLGDTNGVKSTTVAFDVGLGVEFAGRVTLRLRAGLGRYEESGTTWGFTEEGITALVALAPMFFAGAEGNVMQVSNYYGQGPNCAGGEPTCSTLVDENLHGTLGVRF